MSIYLPGLYIVSTPIGNLEDITLRAINVLKNSDQILCEDTRRSIKLLNHYKIKKKLVSNHKFNEKKNLGATIRLLKEKKVISLISDAGTPNLSDPGNILVKECIKENIRVIPIPGPSSVTAAMSISGFDDKFIFYGFLPKKNKEIEKVCKKLSTYDFCIIFFVSAIKLNFYMKFFKKFFSNRQIFIAREMTKIHEAFYWKNLDQFNDFEGNLKGEITLIISRKSSNLSAKTEIDQAKLHSEILRYLKRYSLKDVVKLISEKNNLSKKKVYDLCLKLNKK